MSDGWIAFLRGGRWPNRIKALEVRGWKLEVEFTANKLSSITFYSPTRESAEYPFEQRGRTKE